MSNIRKKIAACLAVLLLFSVTSCENLNKTAQNDGCLLYTSDAADDQAPV